MHASFMIAVASVLLNFERVRMTQIVREQRRGTWKTAVPRTTMDSSGRGNLRSSYSVEVGESASRWSLSHGPDTLE
jgi:hypothetical protein